LKFNRFLSNLDPVPQTVIGHRATPMGNDHRTRLH